MKTRFCFFLMGLLGLVNLMNGQSCLEADYPFTGNADDVSGNNPDAVVHGATLATDRFGNPASAFEFDGTNDYLDTETSFDYPNRTVSMWAYPHDVATTIRILDQDADALLYGAFTAGFENGDIRVNPGGNSVVVANNVQPNKWYHIVLIREGSSSRVYIDGELVYTGGATGNGSFSLPNEEMVIGTWRAENDHFFDGIIDDIKVFSCALNANEVQELYTGDTICIQASYPFSGNANDTSTNKYDGVIHGAVSAEDRFGEPNSAFFFDGNDDYIDTEVSFDFEFRTVSVWAKPSTLAHNTRIIDQDAGSLDYGAMGINLQSDGSLYVNAGGNVALLAANIDTGQWYHFALVRDGDTNRIYLNGQLELINLSGANGSFNTPNPELVIGTFRGENANFFHGSIDDLVVYDCALSASEVLDLYNLTPIGFNNPEPTVHVGVYPNPLTNQAVLQIGSLSHKALKVQLLDMTGRVVRSYFTLPSSSILFDRGSLPAGLYKVLVTGEDKVIGSTSLLIQ